MLHGCSLMVMGQHRRYLSIKATGAHSTLQAHWLVLPGTAYAPLVAQPVAQDTTGPCAAPATQPTCLIATTKAGLGQWTSGRPLLGQQSRLDSLVEYERK